MAGRLAKTLGIIFAVTVISCWLGALAFAEVSGHSLTKLAVATDIGLFFFFFSCLAVFSRRLRYLACVQALMIAVFYVGNGVKISVLGGPIIPQDIAYASLNLIRISYGWELAALVVPFAFLGALLLFNFAPRRLILQTSVALAVSALAFLVLADSKDVVRWVDKSRGHQRWDQLNSFVTRGAVLYLSGEALRFANSDKAHPQPQDVCSALRSFPQESHFSFPGTPRPGRSVHLIMVESFWDPSPLTNAGASRDPLYEGFRALWTRAGNSTAFSPVFGSGTANAEFEALCGFPATESSIIFERKVNSALPCLPNLLRDKGYYTTASHPNIPVFWNRRNAYPNLGFHEFWSRNDYVHNDLNGPWLADRALYTQTAAKLSTSAPKNAPIFSYIMTLSLHRPYPVGRPVAVTGTSAVTDVNTYINAVYYTSRDLYEYIQQIHTADPDALVIAVGDHLPILGGKMTGFAESNVLKPSKASYDADMYLRYLGTPLLVMDGADSPLTVGRMPMHGIPNLIFYLLGEPLPGPQALLGVPPARLHGGQTIAFSDQSVGPACNPSQSDAACAPSLSWAKNAAIIMEDVVFGNQHALKEACPL